MNPVELTQEIINSVKRQPNGIQLEPLIGKFPTRMGHVVKSAVFAMTGKELSKTEYGYKVNYAYLMESEEAGKTKEVVDKDKVQKKKERKPKMVTINQSKPDPDLMERERRFWGATFSPPPVGGVRVFRLGSDGKYRNDKGVEMEGGVHEETLLARGR